MCIYSTTGLYTPCLNGQSVKTEVGDKKRIQVRIQYFLVAGDGLSLKNIIENDYNEGSEQNGYTKFSFLSN